MEPHKARNIWKLTPPPSNPIATAAQLELEALALQIMQEPSIETAKAEAAQRFKILAGLEFPAEAMREFDDYMTEWAFHYVLLASNSDPNYPKALGSFFGPPHEWFGMKVPGGRGPGTAENPDNHYTVIPIDPLAEFELHGKRSDPLIGDCPMHITGNLGQGMNLATLLWRNVQVDDDGTFIITIGPSSADGKTNHLQTDLDARWLFIRDCRLDWNEKPNAYAIRRLSPPTAPPLTRAQLILRAARWMVDDVPMNWWFRQMIAFVDVNTVTQPAGSAAFSGQPSQKLVRGRLKLGDDEVYVLQLYPGDFDYTNLSLNNFWEMTPSYWERTSSLNNTQSVANTDGSYTYVFSNADPGVHNWIDMIGFHEILFLVRMQSTGRITGHGEPWTKGNVIKRDQLSAVLPMETKWLDADQRQQQLKERLENFNRRYTES